MKYLNELLAVIGVVILASNWRTFLLIPIVSRLFAEITVTLVIINKKEKKVRYKDNILICILL